MKYKLIIGILVLLVASIMLMANAMSSGWPPAWINQATLSTVDSNPSQDPENSGFGTTQVAVWEEWNGNDWDIYMNYSLADGALGTWVFPALHPATTAADEINPAVTVTNTNPVTAATEIHVVYELIRLVGGFPQSDIYHTWTNNFGNAWIGPTRLDLTPNNDAKDPAIVYTEDLSNPGVGFTMLVQFVWSEIDPATGFMAIYYDAFYYDPTLAPVRNYISATIGTQNIRSNAGENCELPEIASVDESLNGLIYDYYFAIVWQESAPIPTPPWTQWNVWYIDGTTTTSGGAGMAVALGAAGLISFPNANADSKEPDIAATQDYLGPGAETYYFHVDWVYNIFAPPVPPPLFQIDSCYSVGAVPTPGAASFFIIAPPARGPGLNFLLDKPTIASKVIALNPTVFETWMAWEDYTNVPGTTPGIWYRVGTYTVGAPLFIYTWGPARVPYLPPAGTIDCNPELWNRDDSTRLMPPLTHLVFDQDVGNGIPEIEYIDP